MAIPRNVDEIGTININGGCELVNGSLAFVNKQARKELRELLAKFIKNDYFYHKKINGHFDIYDKEDE